MEVAPLSNLYCDDDKNLEQLLETFGSVVSVEDIASAYCEAGRNVDMAAEKLCNIQRRTSGTSMFSSNDEHEPKSTFSGWSSYNILEKSSEESNSILSKRKKCPASTGTISGIIGREYTIHRSLTNGASETAKPPKINLNEVPNPNELPISLIWDEKVQPDIRTTDKIMHKDIEDFLYTMLGDGFQLQMNVIREVLGACGYDLEKSMEKLLAMSACTLEKSDDVLNTVAQKPMEMCPADKESSLCQSTLHHTDAVPNSKVSHVAKKEQKFPNIDKDRYDLQREVLGALFSSQRLDEASERTQAVKHVRRSRPCGQVVVEPLIDTVITSRTVTTKTKLHNEDTGYNNENYDHLRKAVKEYWTIMKEYYKSAIDELAKGNLAQGYKLVEEGDFYKQKAREADEKSAKKLLETSADEEEVSLDLHDHEPREAIRLLKPLLLNFSGIPSIQCLKLIVGKNDEDNKEGARKKWIIKLLDRESITWTEEENGRIIIIRVDTVNPKKLSFAKKE